MKILEIIAGNHEEHGKALQDTGFWGRAGAGCLFLSLKTGRICISHRSEDVQEPHTWGTWGGAIDSNESPQAAAQREVQEEAGYFGPSKIVPLFIFSHPSGFKYYNFLAVVEDEFSPELDWETQGFTWVEFGKWPRPLHPGLASLLSDSSSVNTIKTYVEAAKKLTQQRNMKSAY